MSLFLSPERHFYILFSYLVSDQRWLTIRLHYLNHTPSDYDPPSFIRVSEKSPVLKFHENETKEVEKLDVGGLNAGFHASVLLSLSLSFKPSSSPTAYDLHRRVSLKISSTNETDSQERPRRRRGSRFVHADVDIEALQFATAEPQPSVIEPPVINEHTKPQESAESVNKQPTLSNQAINEVVPTPDRRFTEITGRDIQEKMFLRGMLRQATRENDVIATQPLPFGSQLMLSRSVPGSETPSNSRQSAMYTGSNPTPKLTSPHSKSTFPKKQDQLSKVPETDTPQRQRPRKKNASIQYAPTFLKDPLTQVTNAIESVDKNMAKLKLSKAKTTELKMKGKHSNKRAPGGIINKSMGDTGRSKDHINCECGDEKLEEDMICCDNCDEWQHTECYGFASAKDTRIPDYHVCYSCLLGKNEAKLLEEMRNMALFRRALKTIWRQGSFPSSNKIFANKLGVFLSLSVNNFLFSC